MSKIMMDGAYPVLTALKEMRISQSGIQLVLAHDWMSFGKMDSHLYRKKLMERFTKAGLQPFEKFMVYFLFSAVKNQKRVLDGMDSLPDDLKAADWFPKVRAFVDSNLCQYVSQVPKQKKFPAVNIPVTNPGMDLLCWALWVDVEACNLVNFFRRPNASQLNLNEMAQSTAKVGYAYYWNNIVKGTKNPDAKEMDLPKPAMREEYYENAANDKYQLVTTELKLVPAPAAGYSLDDIEIWLFGVKLIMNLAKFAVTKSKHWFLVREKTAPADIHNFDHFITEMKEWIMIMGDKAYTEALDPSVHFSNHHSHTEKGKEAVKPGATTTTTGVATPAGSTTASSSKPQVTL